jgi:hypothetical protein
MIDNNIIEINIASGTDRNKIYQLRHGYTVRS